jgi:hypothetical protein
MNGLRRDRAPTSSDGLSLGEAICMLAGAGITGDGAAGAHYCASQGGTSVTITGAMAVTFGGTTTGVTIVNATTNTEVRPARAAGVVDVAVTASAGTGTGSMQHREWWPAPTGTGSSAAEARCHRKVPGAARGFH